MRDLCRDFSGDRWRACCFAGAPSTDDAIERLAPLGARDVDRQESTGCRRRARWRT